MRKPKQKCVAPIEVSDRGKVLKRCGVTKIEACGLCPRHYQAARRLVLADETTWEALEKKGHAKRGKRGNPGGDMRKAVLGSK
jgi:hypothetical protein